MSRGSWPDDTENSMTEQNKPSFAAQADSAATRLKAKMGLESRQVEVDESGNPLPPPPPPGSYAAMIREQSGEVAQTVAVNEALASRQTVEDPVGSSPAEEQRYEPSENAQRRIKELIGQLKETKNLLESERARTKQTEDELIELRRRQEEQIHEQMESLSREDRASVMEDQALRRMLAEQEKKFRQQLDPLLTKARRDEMRDLASRYPGFNPEIHPELIEIFRQRNPNCTMEQAFRAVALPEELNVGFVRPAVVPPTVAPRPTAPPRSLPEQEIPQEQQEQDEMQQKLVEARALASSPNAADRRSSDRLFRELLAKRTGRG
jgi:hypothetical protein